MGKGNDRINVNLGLDKDGIGITLQALFDGMESMLQSKTVVGEPIEAGGAVIIPLLEISAGLASGVLKNNAHNNSAGAMNARVSPVAMLIIQDGRVRLVNVRDQDIFTRLMDMIPEAIDKIKKGAVSKEARSAAEDILESMTAENIEVIEADRKETDN